MTFTDEQQKELDAKEQEIHNDVLESRDAAERAIKGRQQLLVLRQKFEIENLKKKKA